MIYLRAVSLADEENFIAHMRPSMDLHYPWVEAATKSCEFQRYYQKYQAHEQESLLICVDTDDKLAGVINFNDIDRINRSAYLGFYATYAYAGQGLMFHALSMGLSYAFDTLNLAKIYAEVQATNLRSLKLIQGLNFKKLGLTAKYSPYVAQWVEHEKWQLTKA